MPSAFQLKTKPEIQNQMMATMRAQVDPDIDLNVGSLDRGFIEASALQDAEQYVQMSKLVDLFARGNCKGDDLDRRAEDFGAAVFQEMKRRPAQTSIGSAVVGDGTVRKTAALTIDVSAGATSFSVDDATGWPVSGQLIVERGTLREESIVYTRSANVFTVVLPVATGLVNPHLQAGKIETTSTKSILQAAIFAGAATAQLKAGTETAWPAAGSVILERDTARRELRTFTRVGQTLTFGVVTTFAHAINTDVILSTFGSDRPISIGSIGYVPESQSTVRILFRTSAAGTLFDGDLVSALIAIESDATGVQTKVGSNTITQWQAEPFAGATITNPNAMTRGRDREDDDTYNSRISAFIQSLSRATPLAIETLVAGKQDPFSNATVAFAQTIDPVAPGEAQLYITDGTPTFSIDAEVKTGRAVLISDARVNDKRAKLPDYGPFAKVASPTNQITPRIYRNSVGGSGVATLVGANFLEDNLQAWTVNQWAGFTLKTDDNQFFPIASNTAIRLTLTAGGVVPSLGSYAIFDLRVTANPLIPGTDYAFSQSTGDLELVLPLAVHESIIAADDNALGSVGAYTYTRGLGAYAQRLVNGDKVDLDNYPGIKALGTQCRVIAPTVITPTITVQILTTAGLADSDLQSTVQSVVQAYVNSLGIGQPVLIAEITRIVKGLPGVSDCKVISPTANIVVSDGQVARMNATDVVVA